MPVVFLSKFPKKFNKIGLDLDKRSSEIGEKFNIKILNKKLGDEDLNKNTFNLIIFRGVIKSICMTLKLQQIGHIHF